MRSTLLDSVRGLGLACLLLAASCGGGGGGGDSAPAPPPPVSFAYTDSTSYSSASGASLGTPNEITSVTHHTITVGGTQLAYTATAGHLTALAMGTGAPQASFFYVAYTLDGVAPATRPVTFFYNGGPGSATVWLHLGSYGPRRLATGMPDTTAPTPFALVDNAETLLDVSDLVFVDAVGSGWSEAVAPNINRSFWSVDADGAVFRDFVMRYAIVNHRESSPKFLFGESYGTTRSAVLADLLESAGVPVAGVVLQSAVLDYNSNCALTAKITLPCSRYLPTYAATAAWYQKSTPVPSADMLPDFLTQARTFALTRYDPALRSGAPPDAAIVSQLSAFSGLSTTLWQQSFNLPPDTFRAALMPGTRIGRYDARVNVPDTGVAPGGDDDPSSFLLTTSFSFRITDYLANELKYTTPSGYVLLSGAINVWNFSHGGRSLPDTVPDLAAAFAQNPRLKVLVFDGYNDLATPFFVTEGDVARLGNADVQIRSYTGGHMLYLDDRARVPAKADLAAFYRRALAN
jgi:carboxypeptidase C (cathepsin A)